MKWRPILPRLKRLSGREVAGIMGAFGFEFASQRGSHMKLRRITPNGEKQVLTVPNHRELDTGTCRAILRQATRFVPHSELVRFFYSD